MRSQPAAIVEHSNDAIFSRTFQGIITTWNAAAARIFGFRAEEIIGRPSRLLVPREHWDQFRRRLARGSGAHSRRKILLAHVRCRADKVTNTGPRLTPTVFWPTPRKQQVP